MRRSLVVASIAVALALASSEVARAQLPANLKIGDAELGLNGSGARTKYLLQMYVAGLYLAAPSGDAPAIVAADVPMAIRLRITSGLVSQEKMDESLSEGFTNSTGGKPEPLRQEIDQFRKLFAAPIAKGDVFDIVYLPTHGVVVLKNGKKQGAVQGLAFKQALFGIWLGDKPADDNLKVALLKK
jgi:hypothetical protein